jgi:dihydroorotate dehydrogenase electron transfer subunit
MFRSMGVELVLTTEDGSLAERTNHRSTRAGSRKHGRRRGRHGLCVRAPERMLAAVARLAAHGRPSRNRSSVCMGCGVGGCYSCVIPIQTSNSKPHFVRACLAGPVFRGTEIGWEAAE